MNDRQREIRALATLSKRQKVKTNMTVFVLSFSLLLLKRMVLTGVLNIVIKQRKQRKVVK